MSVTFTVDLEDPTEIYDPNGRYVIMAERLLDLCDEVKCKATFFTIGRIASSAPALVRKIAERGHEIAYHSHNHVPLTEESPERFATESRADKAALEQLTGKPIIGFRAPRFSLTPSTLWSLDILADMGFRYSSSIMPTAISMYGFPGKPREPFAWPNGMIEFPLPVKTLGPLAVPYLGGIYLYTLPSALTKRWKESAPLNEVLWTYTHPYDFDKDEPFSLMPGVSAIACAILWTARKVAEKKIRRLLETGTAPTFAEIITKRI
ncbi:MAG: polysaccharide deacetylase family protein [Alphaproteobacteria bacterium]|nr:polysaccharide deacetylase family protein [Alphaproteobacteria bacterium]